MRKLALAILLIYLPTIAIAHDHKDPNLDNWFRSLKSPRSPCCTGEDGDLVKDVDWTIGDTKDCKVTQYGNEEDNKEGHFCVRLKGVWWLIPDKAVVGDPNRLGPAIVWPLWYGSEKDELFVRCFLPGAGA